MYDKSKYSLVANEIYRSYRKMIEFYYLFGYTALEIKYIIDKGKPNPYIQIDHRTVNFAFYGDDFDHGYDVRNAQSIIDEINAIVSFKEELDISDKDMIGPTSTSFYDIWKIKRDGSFNADLLDIKPETFIGDQIVLSLSLDFHNTDEGIDVGIIVSRSDGDDETAELYAFTSLEYNDGVFKFTPSDGGTVARSYKIGNELVEIVDDDELDDDIDYDEEEVWFSYYLNDLAAELNAIAKEDGYEEKECEDLL